MKPQSENFLLADKTDWENPDKGIRRQIMGYNGAIMLVKVVFEQGATGYLHTHPHSQSTYVSSGKFEVTINNEKCTLSAGDGFFAEPNAPHGVLCLEAGILIDAFSPAREDFLK